MNQFLQSLTFSVLLCFQAGAEPPSLEIPLEIRPAGQYVTLVPRTEAKTITYIGLSGVDPVPAALLKDPRVFLLDTRGLPQGRYKFTAVASLNDEHTRLDFTVIQGNPPVVTQPDKPDETNPQHPATLPLKGMRVLILEESSPDRPYPPGLQTALRSPRVRAYLDEKTLKGPTGLPEWRKYDPDSSLANLPKEWPDLRAKLKPTSYPWVAIADGSGVVVHEGPYPASEQEALTYFQKFGG